MCLWIHQVIVYSMWKSVCQSLCPSLSLVSVSCLPTTGVSLARSEHQWELAEGVCVCVCVCVCVWHNSVFQHWSLQLLFITALCVSPWLHLAAVCYSSCFAHSQTEWGSGVPHVLTWAPTSCRAGPGDQTPAPSHQAAILCCCTRIYWLTRTTFYWVDTLSQPAPCVKPPAPAENGSSSDRKMQAGLFVWSGPFYC